MTTAVLASEAAVQKVDKRIAELWVAYGRILPHTTTVDWARLWRQIDALLDKRLELTG